jgi:formamidopyrimidine-DNA glycosylase
VTGRRVTGLVVREPRLRWPVDPALPERVRGTSIERVERRAKYLLLRTQAGTMILHLGMSGSLRVLPAATPPGPHDHLDLLFEGGQALRLTDPRRFGCLLWARDPDRHPLLAGLGPEPLEPGFTGACLYRAGRGRRAPVKSLIMDGRVVAGVGNIYASESLFLAGIHPARAAGRIGPPRYERLAAAVRQVLAEAIEAGGTTLRDFVGADGRPGYFGQRLRVYEREGDPCDGCGRPLRRRVIAQRASYYCPACQR